MVAAVVVALLRQAETAQVQPGATAETALRPVFLEHLLLTLVAAGPEHTPLVVLQVLAVLEVVVTVTLQAPEQAVRLILGVAVAVAVVQVLTALLEVPASSSFGTQTHLLLQQPLQAPQLLR
jgi:hypothetical protein